LQNILFANLSFCIIKKLLAFIFKLLKKFYFIEHLIIYINFMIDSKFETWRLAKKDIFKRERPSINLAIVGADRSGKSVLLEVLFIITEGLIGELLKNLKKQ